MNEDRKISRKRLYGSMCKKMVIVMTLTVACQAGAMTKVRALADVNYDHVERTAERANGIRRTWQTSKYFGVRPFKVGDKQIIVKTQPHYFVDIRINGKYQYNYTKGENRYNRETGKYETIGKERVYIRADYKGIAVLNITRILDEKTLQNEEDTLKKGDKIEISVSGDDGFYLDSVSAITEEEEHEKDSDLYKDPQWNRELNEYDQESDEDYYFEQILGQDPKLRGITESWQKSRYFGIAPIKAKDGEINVKSVPYARVLVILKKKKADGMQKILIDARSDGSGIAKILLKDKLREVEGFSDQDLRILEAGDMISVVISGDDGFYLDSMYDYEVKTKEELEEEQKRKEAEERQKAEEEQKRKEAEERQKAEEEQKRKEAEERQKAEEERKRKETEERQKAEEERKRKEAEESRKAEEERKRKEAEKRKAEEERKRKEVGESRKAEEEQKRKEVEESRKAEGEQRRKEAEESRKAGGEQRQKEAEESRKAGGEQKRKEAEESRKAEGEQKQKAEKKTEPKNDIVTVRADKLLGSDSNLFAFSYKIKKVEKQSEEGKKIRKKLKNKKLVSRNILHLNLDNGKLDGKKMEDVERLVVVSVRIKKMPKKIYVMNLKNGKLMKADYDKKEGKVKFKTTKGGRFVLVQKLQKGKMKKRITSKI